MTWTAPKAFYKTSTEADTNGAVKKKQKPSQHPSSLSYHHPSDVLRAYNRVVNITESWLWDQFFINIKYSFPNSRLSIRI